ncbi:MAG: HIT domain-containing protein [Candidatus Cloacimonetes bacterium]|nr:HIT domain-containing protein [Candidatus Cloacimonadota bacterium]
MSDRLYSPWRLEYILSVKDEECIFCIEPSKENDEKHLILFRNKLSFIIMNTYPYNNGHLLIVPNKHVANLNDLSKQESTDLIETVQICEKIIKNVYTPDGLNIGVNLGKAAGAGIDDHLHVHVVPRWNGDVNFMSTLGETRVIPESFQQAYAKLKEEFDNEKVKK